MKTRVLLLSLLLSTIHAQLSTWAQDTAFTYQDNVVGNGCRRSAMFRQ